MEKVKFNFEWIELEKRFQHAETFMAEIEADLTVTGITQRDRSGILAEELSKLCNKCVTTKIIWGDEATFQFKDAISCHYCTYRGRWIRLLRRNIGLTAMLLPVCDAKHLWVL